MREQGTVITVHDGVVDVLMRVSADCAGCSACSHGAGGETVMHDVTDAFGSTVGDVVDVEIPDTIRSRAAAAIFIVPVASLFVGYLAGFLLGRLAGFDPEAGGVAGALVLATVAMLGIRGAEHRLAGDAAFTPRVGGIIARGRDRS